MARNYVYSIVTGFRQTRAGRLQGDGRASITTRISRAGISPCRRRCPTIGDLFATAPKATVDQERPRTSSTFLSWAAEPKLEERHSIGFGVMVFLLVLSGLLYLSYRQIWKDAH